MKKVWAGVMLASLLAAAPRDAFGQTAEEYLGEALEYIDSGFYDEAEDALNEAEALDPEPLMLAEIYRQRGVIAQLRNRPAEAVRRFLEMIEQDPSIQLRQPPYRPSVVELYVCARRLTEQGMSPDEIEARLRRAELSDWVCPAPAEPTLEVPPRPAPSAAPGAELTATPPPEPERGFPVLPAVGLGLGAATLGTGIGLGVDAESQAEQGIDKTGQADVANVLVGVGIGVAAIGAGWLIWQLVDG